MAPIEIDDDDDDVLPSLMQTRRAHESSRRSVSRAPSVASSSNNAGASHASTRRTGASGSESASTSRTTRARSSVSATPELAAVEQSALPTSEATLESDTPTVAAYSSRAAGPSQSLSKTPPPKARSRPKRPLLDPQAQAELARRRQQEEDADDFFTHKPALSFRTKKPVNKALLKQTNGGAASSASAPVAAELRKKTSMSPPPSKSNKGKERVIELDDDDDEVESSHGETSDSEDAESDPYERNTPRAKQKPKSKKKKVQPEIRRPSPLKRPEPGYESSSSSSSAYSFSSNSSVQRIRRDKHKDKKNKASNVPKREKSLSPIETVDSYVLAHVLHDVRRKNNLRQTSILEDLDAEAVANGTGVAGSSTSTSGYTANVMSPAPEDHLSRQLRSPSAAVSDAPPPRGTSFSLTPLPEMTFLTEEDLELKFGSVVIIKVEMVYDPRLPVTDLNREHVKRYESTVNVKSREKETFHRLFTAISQFKSVPKDQLAFTYNGKTVYQSGSPSALKIISNATFKGYTKDVLAYVKQHGEAVLERHNRDNATAATGPTGSGSESLQHRQANTGPTSAAAIAPATAHDASNKSPEAPQAEPLRLTIRAGPDQTVRLAIPPSKTVFSVIKHFLKKMKIDVDKAHQCKMLFDGEELEHEAQLKDTDVEDEDTLDVKIPA
ncbi:hypothetical protein P389DRAFT_196714 [Cystobasidium minutum MCA 4210]|uniref:uncharacterized protein n=1 Tax=Cystobasidium minutum MCA 4210 TaxID=1397322 RepID=UPI0034CDE931|eukprot:jgi/Rhomi1/196714/gm1.4928_g